MAKVDKIKHAQRNFIDNWGVIIYNSTIDSIKQIVTNYKLFLEKINNVKITYQKATEDLSLYLDCDFDIEPTDRLKLKKLYEIAAFLLDNKITYLCKV